MNNCTKDDSIQLFNQCPESNDWECLTKMLSCGDLQPWCSYADDLILFMLDIHSLQRTTTILDEVFTKNGLCINIAKTETMILVHMLLENEYPDTIISLHNVLLQNSTRVKFLNSFVCSRLTYSCQNWDLIVSQSEKLDITYQNLLTRMIRGGFRCTEDNDEDFWYKLNNEKVHVICCTSNVGYFIWKQQKDYAGHVVRMPFEHCEKQLMFNGYKYHNIYENKDSTYKRCII